MEQYFKELFHVQAQIERINADDSSRPDIEDAYIQIKSIILKKLKGTRRESIMESSLLNQTCVEILHTHRLQIFNTATKHDVLSYCQQTGF